MTRNTKGFLLFISLPWALGIPLAFIMVWLYAAAGFDMKLSEAVRGSMQYVGGAVCGWWLFGGRP